MLTPQPTHASKLPFWLRNSAVALAFVAGGVFILTRSVTQSVDAYGKPSYDISLSLLLGIAAIILGLGLFKLKTAAHRAARAVFLLGMTLAVTAPPLLLIVHPLRDGQIGYQWYLEHQAGVIGYLPKLGALFDETWELAIALSITLLLPSAVAFRLYRYYGRVDIAERFNVTPATTPAWRLGVDTRTLLTVVAVCALGLLSTLQVSVLQSKFPEALRAEYFNKQQGEPLSSGALNPIRQIQFSADGHSLAIALRTGELLLLDTATHQLTRKDARLYEMADSPGLSSSRLVQRLSPNQKYFIAPNGSLIDVNTDRARQLNALPHGDDIYPLGFAVNDQFFLMLDQGLAKLMVFDIALDRLRFETPATRAEWLQGNDYKRPLASSVGAGVFSPDRRYYAYVYNRHLHVLDIETSSLDISEVTVDARSAIIFSTQGDWLMVYATGDRPDREPGLFYNLQTHATRDHALGGHVLQFSMLQGSVILHDQHALFRYSLQDMAEPILRIDLPEVTNAQVSSDGRLLWVQRPRQVSVEYVEMAKLSRDQPPPFRALGINHEFLPTDLTIAPTHQYLALVQGPLLEILNLDTLTSATPIISTVDLRYTPLSATPRSTQP